MSIRNHVQNKELYHLSLFLPMKILSRWIFSSMFVKRCPAVIFIHQFMFKSRNTEVTAVVSSNLRGFNNIMCSCINFNSMHRSALWENSSILCEWAGQCEHGIECSVTYCSCFVVLLVTGVDLLAIYLLLFPPSDSFGNIVS